MEIKTALYDRHVCAGGKLVPFADYLLPMQYSGIAAEHNAVRTAAGLFDVSHMGELSLEGTDALANLQNLLTNDFLSMNPGQVRYSPLCNPDGGMLDDLLVYRRAKSSFLLVVNAANRKKDVAWIASQLFGDVRLADQSDQTALLALQGPKAQAVLTQLGDAAVFPQKNYSFQEHIQLAGIRCLLSRTGYTGEDGFELYLQQESAPALWDAILTAGEPFGLLPCGLGARDTLRLEAAMPLYGHEMDETVSPVEAGLSWAVKLQKENFIGKKALETNAARRKRIGLFLKERGIARAGDAVFADEKQIGFVTSGTMAPFLRQAIAMALVEEGCIRAGTEIFVEIRGKRLAAKQVALPFYKRETP